MKFRSFNELLSYMSDTVPQKTAVQYDQKGTICSVSYSQLYADVTKRKNELINSGYSSIGIVCDGSFQCATEILAANMAGLQVTMLDQSVAKDNLPALIRYADIDTLYADETICNELSAKLTKGVENGTDRILFFTSGTTSSSKAVVLTGASLCASAWCGNEKLPLNVDDVIICMLPLSHVFGFVCGLLWGLAAGAAVALGRGIRHYADDLTYFRPTVLPAVPMMLQFLLAHQLLNSELRQVLVGAGSCNQQILEDVRKAGIQVSFGYGLTETSSGVALSICEDPYAMEICPGVDIQIAEDGEILISAPDCMMQGYYKSAEKLPVQDSYFCTGDIGFLDNEGKLHITGRKKEIIVLSDGTKIFLPEYEARLAEVIDSREFAVIQKDDRLVLCIQGEKTEQTAIKNMILPLMKTLPRGQQIDQIKFIQGLLPRTATGKIRRYEL